MVKIIGHQYLGTQIFILQKEKKGNALKKRAQSKAFAMNTMGISQS